MQYSQKDIWLSAILSVSNIQIDLVPEGNPILKKARASSWKNLLKDTHTFPDRFTSSSRGEASLWEKRLRPTECSNGWATKQQETHAATVYMVCDSSPGKGKSLGGFSHPHSSTLQCQVQSCSHYQLLWAREEEDDYCLLQPHY